MKDPAETIPLSQETQPEVVNYPQGGQFAGEI